jgi:hypothetical protein
MIVAPCAIRDLLPGSLRLAVMRRASGFQKLLAMTSDHSMAAKAGSIASLALLAMTAQITCRFL